MSESSQRDELGRAGQGPAAKSTLLDKVWDSHLVRADAERDRLHVDWVLLHERQLGIVGSLGAQGVPVACPSQVVTCLDQQLPTAPEAGGPELDPGLMRSLEELEATSSAFDLPIFGRGDHRGGVLNVVVPEQGMTLPGSLVVGSDAHVSTNGAFGAVALVLREEDLAGVMAEGCIERSRPNVARVTVAGSLSPLASAKDLSLWMAGRVGPVALGGMVLELGGPAVRGLSMEGRMTLCNMATETGATAALIAPDEITLQYLRGRPFAPAGPAWERAVASWSRLGSEPGAAVELDIVLVAGGVGPQVTWGTWTHQVVGLDGRVPAPDARDPYRRRLDEEALVDQGLVAGTPLSEVQVDRVFIGSCANARIEDLRAAAEIARLGRAQVPAWVVPGSGLVKRQAEEEGLKRVFLDAGFEWRDPGCSLCIGANGDVVRPGERLASTANRPALGIAGPGGRVHLLGPRAAAASALTGRLTDPRRLAAR